MQMDRLAVMNLRRAREERAKAAAVAMPGDRRLHLELAEIFERRAAARGYHAALDVAA
jgi:hypothetical protein